jgi:hypothetical protein
MFPTYLGDAMRSNGQPGVGSPLAWTLAATSAAGIREPEEGQTIRLPNIQIAPTPWMELSDSISSALTLKSGVTQTGPPPPPKLFGLTQTNKFEFSEVKATRMGGTYKVTATFDPALTFQVTSQGRTDISSEFDSNITQNNYDIVASDLTPNMSVENGTPPRTRFWAEDLTIKHERFHAADFEASAQSGLTLAENWLNTKTATSATELNFLLVQALVEKVKPAIDVGMAKPGSEERAYGNGAPAYLDRANAIKNAGNAGDYRELAPAVHTFVAPRVIPR